MGVLGPLRISFVMKIQFPSLDDLSVSEIIRNALVVIVLVVVVDVVVVL